jgi:DNA-binding NarL/FixJ family response regulator
MPALGRLLIVEDQQLVALDLKGVLTEMGYEVVGLAANPESAIALAREHHPDLALMDINLGGPVDGIATAERLQREFGVPSVFVTAYDDERTLGSAAIAEPYGYVLTPFQARELRIVLRMALFHHQMERERARVQRALEAALAENRVLQGLLSICASCKKIRDGEDQRWKPVEEYVQEHSAARFSHGMCPDCALEFLRESGLDDE